MQILAASMTKINMCQMKQKNIYVNAQQKSVVEQKCTRVPIKS